MKIGIITYHRAHNYGAVLQVYALKTYLTTHGHDVEVIDYWPKYRKGNYDLVDLRFLDIRHRSVYKFLRGIKSIVRLLLSYRAKKQRHTRFQEFIESEIVTANSFPFESKYDLPSHYDLYIYGSDQIWRYNNFEDKKGFDEVYWGKYPDVDCSKKITYGASMGVLQDTPQSRLFLESSINNFSNISVRERSLADWIESVTGNKVLQVLDPAFLIKADLWESISASEVRVPGKYILLYNLNKSKAAEQLAQTLATKYDCEIIVLTDAAKPLNFSNNYQDSAGPREFLSLFKNASYVVSTSFHGVVFSLIFEKQFFSLGLGHNSSRVTDLLEILCLSDRYLQVAENVDADRLIDYESVNNAIDKIKKDSVRYLDSKLSNI